jgi:hypothetical protein
MAAMTNAPATSASLNSRRSANFPYRQATFLLFLPVLTMILCLCGLLFVEPGATPRHPKHGRLHLSL